MSRPQDPHRPAFPFGNPFRMILPKGSYLSPRLLALLNTFESTLAERLIKLKPKDTEDILSLSWMRFAVESLCEIHTDIKRLITSLELPVSDWDEKWIDVYLDNSTKLLDICNAFSSEISRLNQGHLFLQLVVHNLNAADSNQFVRASSSLDGWKKHISLNNPRLEKCFNILENFSQTLSLPKVKKSSKGKVLMRALYGVKVVTVFVCRILIIAFSGCTKNVVDFQVLESCMWSEAFSDFQAYVSGEIKHAFASGRVTALKELEAVDICVKKLYPAIKDGVGTVETIENSVPDLKMGADKLSQGLDSLAKEVDGFFQIVLTGRDALLCNLRVCGNVSNQIQEKPNVEEQIAL